MRGMECNLQVSFQSIRNYENGHENHIQEPSSRKDFFLKNAIGRQQTFLLDA